MKTARLFAVAIALLAATGCFRTVYHHLEPPTYEPATQPVRPDRENNSGWQGFFLYGWAPGEKVIDAAARCGGPGQVQEIRTEQSFLQGFVGVITTYYINIYSPYTGEVVCVGDHLD
jgi:hypothetical protein